MCNLAVNKAYRRRGIAKALLSICEKKVRDDWGKQTLHLEVRDDNIAAKELYFGCGYIDANRETLLTRKMKKL